MVRTNTCVAARRVAKSHEARYGEKADTWRGRERVGTGSAIVFVDAQRSALFLSSLPLVSRTSSSWILTVKKK